MKQDTLQTRISDNVPLNNDEIEKAVMIFGHGCRADTKRELRLVLGLVPSIRSYGIFGRVMFNRDTGGVSYCAGQSYPDEIRTVRSLLLGKR